MHLKRHIIGIDLDNTVINYEKSIRELRKDYYPRINLINNSKEQLKTNIIKTFGNQEWTNCQGLLYGKYIEFAELYDNCEKVISLLQKDGWEVQIISHKTETSINKPMIPLRLFAENWLIENLSTAFQGKSKLQSSIHFCDSIEEKIAKVLELKCMVFVDDLYGVLDLLPKNLKRYWIFQNETAENKSIIPVASWENLYRLISNSND
jgi:hypothetical protein